MGETSFVAIRDNRPAENLDSVAVYLDATVGVEELQAFPEAGDRGELLAD